jgi:hypothetical protein
MMCGGEPNMLLSVLKPTCVNGTAPRTADDKHSDRYYWRIAPAMRNVGGYGTWQRWEWDARATTIMVGRRSIWEQDDDGEDMVRSSLWGPPPRQKKKKRVRPAFISRIDKKICVHLVDGMVPWTRWCCCSVRPDV